MGEKWVSFMTEVADTAIRPMAGQEGDQGQCASILRPTTKK